MNEFVLIWTIVDEYMCGGCLRASFFGYCLFDQKIFNTLCYNLFLNASLEILFYLIKKVPKKIKPDSIRLRLILRESIFLIIASNPRWSTAGPISAHIGFLLYSYIDSFSTSTSLAFIFLYYTKKFLYLKIYELFLDEMRENFNLFIVYFVRLMNYILHEISWYEEGVHSFL